MAKPKNAIPTHKLTIATTPQVVEVLDWLVQQGMYGKSRAEVAEELLRRSLVNNHVELAKYSPGDPSLSQTATKKPR